MKRVVAGTRLLTPWLLSLRNALTIKSTAAWALDGISHSSATKARDFNGNLEISIEMEKGYSFIVLFLICIRQWPLAGTWSLQAGLY